MSDKPAKGMGKLKAIIGALAGLFSGAALMYLSPLIDRVVKPPAPIANFETRQDGLTVTFHDLSTGTANLTGWWDFGDGSPLVPLVAEQDVTHSYPRAGSYTAKLSVRNLLGDTNERTVTVQAETAGSSEPPHIVSLDAVPLIPGAPAPATFKVAGEVKNAQLAVWDLDEGRPLEVSTTPSEKQERLVTFSKPGNYAIKLAAFNGQQHEEKLVAVSVRPAPAGAMTAVLTVTDQATFVEHNDRRVNPSAAFQPGQKGNAQAFNVAVKATPGWTIADVQMTTTGQWMKGQPAVSLDAPLVKAGPVRNLQVKRDADGKTVHVSGELVRNNEKEWPGMSLPLVLREERRKPISRVALPVMAPVTMPGTASLPLPPLPADWQDAKRQVRLELRDGNNRVVWQDSRMPASGTLPTINGRGTLSASQNGDRVDVRLTDR